MKPLRIGINALYLIPGRVGGTEIYLRNLLREFAMCGSQHEFVVFTNRETGLGLAPQGTNFTTVVQPVSAANRVARVLWEQTGLPIVAARHGIDVLFNPGFTSPLLCHCPCVTVFHDMQHKRHPEYFRWFDRPFWRLLLFTAAARSKKLIAVSKSTHNDLLKYYPLHESQIAVISHGVSEDFFQLNAQRDGDYILCVSTLHPHKNLDQLVRTFARLHSEQPSLRLVMAGMRGFHSEILETHIAALGMKDVIEVTGWIERPALLNLYRHAKALCYPSTFEGFGMPILESMAVGLPTVCSDREPMSWVAGNAAILFDPLNDDSLLAAMKQSLLDDEIRKLGPPRARQFSWHAAAEATLEVLAQQVL